MNKRTLVEFVVRFTYEAAAPGSIAHSAAWNGKPPAQPQQIANDALALLRLASQHRRLCEYQCSAEEWGDREEIAREKVENAAWKLLKPYGITLVFNHDPRGPTISLTLPSGHATGPDGFAVPSDGFTAAQMKRMGW